MAMLENSTAQSLGTTGERRQRGVRVAEDVERQVRDAVRPTAERFSSIAHGVPGTRNDRISQSPDDPGKVTLKPILRALLWFYRFHSMSAFPEWT